MVKNARSEEKNTDVNRVPTRQLLANAHDKAPFIHPHLRCVVDLWWGVGLAIHAQFVAASSTGEQSLQNDGRDDVISH